MADQRLTDRASTITITGGIMHIIIPDGGSPSGYLSYKIAVSDLHAGLQANIDANSLAIQSNSDTIEAESAAGRGRYRTKETDDFTFTLSYNYQITRIYVSPTDIGSIKMGTTAGGDNILTQKTLTNGTRRSFEIMPEDGYGDDLAGKTIYVTLVGAASVTIYMDKNIFQL